jgi:hypothetical protein
LSRWTWTWRDPSTKGFAAAGHTKHDAGAFGWQDTFDDIEATGDGLYFVTGQPFEFGLSGLVALLRVCTLILNGWFDDELEPGIFRGIVQHHGDSLRRRSFASGPRIDINDVPF